jgi:protochlorophyllide reductase
MTFLKRATIAIAIFAITIRWLIVSDTKFSEQDVAKLSSGLNIVVTGANSGVGFATVEHFVRAGTSNVVVMACRNMVKCESAKHRVLASKSPNSTTLVLTQQLDLANRESIERFARELPKRLGTEKNTSEAPIDVLINNAGIFASSNSKTYLEGVEEHMLVNHLGHVLLTHSLWPNLVQAKGRIVTISSIIGVVPLHPAKSWFGTSSPSQPWWHSIYDYLDVSLAYARSKRANLLYAFELHRRFGSDGMVSSVASHPGYSRTEIWTNGVKHFPPWVGKFIQTNRLLSMSSEEGALTQVWAAIDPNVASGWYVGPQWWLFGRPIHLGPILDKRATKYWPPHHWPFTQEHGQQLWDQSMETLGIKEFGSP